MTTLGATWITPARWNITGTKEEVYFFFKGEGFVRIDGEEIPVMSGDVIRIPPDSMHTVVNRTNNELLWAALWWPIME